MKSVLISIQPKWCELIASGKKTVEVRKTVPKLEPPFKCYIYCTNAKPYLVWGDVFRGSWENEFTHLSGYNRKAAEEIWDVFNGKVAGEFVCDRIEEFTPTEKGIAFKRFRALYDTCLSVAEIRAYLGDKVGYGWHISDLVIYDAPKELTEFWSADKCHYASEDGCTYEYHCFRAGQMKRCGSKLQRPPQSWCYVEG
jgi:predicted transcriptional regulator